MRDIKNIKDQDIILTIFHIQKGKVLLLFYGFDSVDFQNKRLYNFGQESTFDCNRKTPIPAK